PQSLQFAIFKGMADVKGYQHFNQESLDYCEKALMLTQTDAEKANVLGSRAETERILGQLEKAEATAKAGLALAKKARVPQLQASCLLQLSNVHFYLYKLPEALAEVREAIAIGKKIKSNILPSALTVQSNIYTAMGGENKVLGLENAQKALQLAQKQGAPEAVITANYALSNAYKALDRTDEAVATLRQAEALKDSLYSSEKTRDIARMEKDADFEQERERSRYEQAQKDAAAVVELDRQKSARNGLIGGLLAVLALSGAGFYIFRQRQRLRSAQREADTRQRIARDLHDEVGSTLSAISILSQSLTLGPQEDLDKARFGNIGDKARTAMESMSDIVWAVNPQNDSVQQIIQRMTSFAAETLESAGIVPHFSIPEDVGQLSIPLEKRKDFYLIFKEAVANCAKYSQAQHAKISLKKEGGQLVFELSDDGVGLPTKISSPFGGNGLKNMAARAAAIGAEFSVGNGTDNGTVVLLKIPL
ncbi:MAG: histidine kinase, partial [Saprospiraceae bacterium]|nr:histidine kinase [Saprospiraceae bacterium]